LVKFKLDMGGMIFPMLRVNLPLCAFGIEQSRSEATSAWCLQRAINAGRREGNLRLGM
jgi:hypothetical protein